MIPAVLYRIRFSDLFLFFRKRPSRLSFEKWVAGRLGARYALVFPSGTECLLASLSSLPKRPRVLGWPGYMCEQVTGAVRASGYDLKLFDVDTTLNVSSGKISGCDAYVHVHLSGFEHPLPSSKVPIIEDCAQTLRKKSSSALASFVSFGMGKPLSATGGGVLCTDDKIFYGRAKAYQERFSKEFSSWGTLMRLKLQFFLGSRLVYGIVYPFLRLRNARRKRKSSVYQSPRRSMNGFMRLLVMHFWSRQAALEVHRKDVVVRYVEQLAGVSFVRLSDVSPFSALRFPVFVDDRDGLQSFLRKHGIATTTLYPHSINRFFSLHQSTPVADRLAEEVLFLPTHAGVSLDDANRICTLIERWGEER